MSHDVTAKLRSEMTKRGIHLGRFTAIAILGLAVLLFGLFSVVLGASRQAILDSASAVGQAESRAIKDRVQATLAHAEVAVTDLETDLAHGLDGHDFASVEAALYAELLHHDDLVEASWTYGVLIGTAPDDRIALVEGTRGQISVQRVLDGRLITRHIHEYEGGWVMDVRQRPRDGGLASGPIVRTAAPPSDPTTHLTFITPAMARYRGRTLWSDLAFSELDEILAETDRRKELTVQKAIYHDAPGAPGTGAFAGVVRAGMISDDVDRAAQTDARPGEHRFICDAEGRLVTRLSPDDTYAVLGEDVRAVPAHAPPEVTAALATVAPGAPPFSTVTAGGKDYFFTLAPLAERTQSWNVGVLVPAARYLGRLDAARDRLILYSALLAAAVLVGGTLSLRALRGGLGLVVAETRRIQRFDFERGAARATFAEVNDALGSLEVAKAALRAMGRYVPIELVRLLFHAGTEPELGGAPREVTMMFSDIEGFTTMSESLPPHELAVALGRYLTVVTDAMRQEGGTIDKFIGDSVMVLWNAPLDTPEHARKACTATLAARRALAGLYASPEWDGQAAWVTRFGLHADTVLVGHFGAPDRMSYTALGDGVNLASRIEGLNKLYGTTILVSDAVRVAAGDGFVFRRIDRVAVKGKSQAVLLHELLGAAGEVGASPAHERYEAALDAYFAGRFAAAADLLGAAARSPDEIIDAPSRTLLERCRMLAAEPPDGWDGVYHARSK